MPRPDYRIVYSSDSGSLCPGCGRTPESCACPQAEELPEGDGVVRVRRELKGRKGKQVTTVTGVSLVGDELKDLAKALKKKCGSGGAVKDGVIEIQGDHVSLLLRELSSRGFTVKRSGS